MPAIARSRNAVLEKIWCAKHRENLFVPGVLLALLVFPVAVFAQPLLTTRIAYQPVSHVVPDHRITLTATLSDQDAIIGAQCFFRTDNSLPYLFVPMIRRQGDEYVCTLPALGADVGQLEYLFVVVNGKKRVIRSRAFSASVAFDAAIPAWQSPGTAAEQIKVFSELETFDRGAIAANDDAYDIAFTAGERYGFLVDIYTAEQIPAELNAAHGYFGGFVIDSDNASPRPVKGYGIGLKLPSELRSGGVPEQERSLSARVAAACPPSIGGSDWRGFFQTTGAGNRQSISASISQSGGSVTIVTSKSGLGQHLVGSINCSGHMLLYDQYDGEDWTTHYGPATSTHVAIYDYICPTCSQLNEINLGRNPPPPPPPANISASDGAYLDRIVVAWSRSSGADSYGVYRCITSSTNSCSLTTNTGADSYRDTGVQRGIVYYYRVRACNSGGCGSYSNYDTGYLKSPDITPILLLLLLDS